MTRFKTTLDPRASHKGQHASVTITGDKLEIDIDEQAIAEAQAKAGAQAVARGIRSIPSERGHRPFNVSGHLANSITAQRQPDGSAAVVAPPDRLRRDSALLEKLVDLVPELRRPADAPEVQKALEQSASAIVKVQR